MNSKEKAALKSTILSKYELHNRLIGGKFRRLMDSPFRALHYYMLQSVGYIHPYTVKHKTLWGETMQVCLPEAGSMYYYGFLEVNLSNFFINFFKEGDTFFDVGAHIGYYTRLVSLLIGPTGHVYSFEPTPRTFKILEKNAKHIKNIKVHNVAILDENSEIDFFDYGARHSVFNTFQKRTDESIQFKDDVATVKVKTIKLDSYCKENNITPTFIKIDAEGAEPLILKSLDHVLDTIHPFVTIEVSNCEEWEDNRKDSFDYLSSKGYVCYEINLEGNLQKYTSSEVQQFDNLLFVHPKKLSRVEHLII